MKQLKHKIVKLFLRHPVLYYIRYLILSKNSKGDLADQMDCFNDINTSADIPQLYFDVNAKISLNADWDEFEKAIAIGRYLRTNIRGGSGLGLCSEKTLQKMLAGMGGVCSDFAQIFNIFCLLNGVKVREWGCIDRFYNTRFGHSFNEVYSSKRQQWIAIDIHKGIIFKDAGGGLLSTTGLFNYLRANHDLKYEFFSDYCPKKIERIPDVYSKITTPFVISNYRNSVYDHFLEKFRKYPPFIINAIMILYGKNHHFVFVMDNYIQKLLPRTIRNLV